MLHLHIDIERDGGYLHIEAEAIDDPSKMDYNTLFDELQEALFWEDMYFETFGNEWLYITDANNNVVYMVTDYNWDCIKELLEDGETDIPVSSMTYQEHENEMEA